MVKPTELLDGAVLALEHMELKGQFSVMQAQVTTQLASIASTLSALQTEAQAQSRAIHNVEIAQASLQAHSTAFERLAQAIDRASLDNMNWRKEHEEQNALVADRVTTFKGVLIGLTALAGVTFTLATMWFSAELTSIHKSIERIEHQQNRSQR